MPNYWRARINPRVARGKVRVLHNGMGQQRSASPPNPCVLVALCQIERERPRGEDPGIDSGLLRRRRISAKNGVTFPTPAGKQLPRGDLASGVLLAASREMPTMKTLRSGLGLGASGLSCARTKGESSKPARTSTKNRRMVKCARSLCIN